MPKFLNIHESAVQSFIRPGGAVADLLNDVARDTKLSSMLYISNGHVRSGRLLRGLFWNRTKLSGPLQGYARAGSSARHTLYFHDGTPEIFHKNMIIPKNRHAALTNLAYKGAGSEQLAKFNARTVKQKARGRGITFRDSVRGQRAKPFLTEGLASSLAKHGLK